MEVGVGPARFVDLNSELYHVYNMQANTLKPKPRPTQGSQTGVYKVDSIKVEYLFQNDLVC
jgi:hypothetical protein